MLAIFKREFKAYFTTPVGYVILAIYLFFSGLFFANMYSYGYPYISFIFSQMFTIVMFTIPVITMRMMSEDKRQKTDQALLTAPVKLGGIVMGKFFAALAFFLLAFSEIVLFQIILAFKSTPDMASFIGNIIGLVLFGSALIAVGIFISSLTESQTVAAIGSFAVSLLLLLMDSIATFFEGWGWNAAVKVIEWISFSGRYNTFTEGIIDLSNIVFFISFAGIFLFLTTRVLEKKRYS